MGKILTLVDGSLYTRSVCQHAAWAARRLSADVEIMMVLGRRYAEGAPLDLTGSLGPGSMDEFLEEITALDEKRAKVGLRQGRVVLDQMKAVVEGEGVASVETTLLNGDLIETVEGCEPNAQMTVIGKRGMAADFARMHLGSNVERVIRLAKRPVLVAARAFNPIDRIMIAFDGGPSSVKAVEHVSTSPLFQGLGCTLFFAGKAEGEVGGALKTASDRLSSAGFDVEIDVMPGDPGDLIAERAERDGVDLLVMGAYGHSRIRSLIVGSTTTEMIRRCRVPVMLIR